MLTYRTLFTMHPRQPGAVVEEITQHFFRWLDEKGLESGAVKPNQETVVSENATVKWLVPDTGDLAGTQRLILTEKSPQGDWTSTLTVRDPVDGAPWFWMDVDGTKWAGAPRIVRALIDEYSCFDRGVKLTQKPVVVQAQQVDDLIRVLTRHGRRTLSFIAGSSPELPLKSWQEFVGRILRQTVGQASGYVLDPSATDLFNSKVGPAFAVRPGMLRTFLPELDVDDQQDAARHRFVTASSIAGQDSRRLGKTLSYKAREVAQETLLDENVRLIDRRLDDFAVRLPLPIRQAGVKPVQRTETAGADKAPTNNTPVVPGEVSGSPGEPMDRVPDSHGEASQAHLAEEAEIYLSLRSLVEEYSGRPASVDSVNTLTDLLEAGRGASALSTRLLSIVDQKSAALDEAAVEQARLRHLIEDLELDSGETWELLEAQYERTQAAQEAELRLRALLASAGADTDWASLDVPESPAFPAPSNFNSLVELVTDLPYLVFTGNKDVTAALDDHDAVGRWCAMTWSILLALNDYARMKAEGIDSPGVHSYLESAPAGGRTYPPGRHARDESESVKNNPTFRKPRVLPVPLDVDSSGEAFMGAHFRIAKHGLISPRLHYLDATGATGHIIVGYIGPHLPNTQTN
ncbi:hypothetical protein BN1051_03047 [Arthrobacter saudimassiliensis]|uniref:Uncharacterized protein n=1 Tax=Arthrobacter saudimassiliensis TaxID=1461584 RepID=A0A078MTL9_9MICC|nr:hypothetical protein BN1051_03047 [Arthrobacter saudimassiliensis]